MFLYWALGWSSSTICHVECKYLGQAYCVLVLGLEQQHHMSCGMSVPGAGLLCSCTGPWAGEAALYVIWNVSSDIP